MDKQLHMTFVRYLNATDTKKKIIGFSIKGPKEDIFDIMLQSLCDFTIPGSTCNIYYRLTSGEVRYKKFIKGAETQYYINGDVKAFKIDHDNIFRSCRPEHFKANLKACCVPENISN